MTYKVAVLDERGVFLRTVQLEDTDAPGARQLDLREFGGDCDLPMGKYRWDAQAKAFVPLPVERQKRAEEAPSLEDAFYALLVDGPQAETVMAWRTWYELTLDRQTKRGF